MVNAAVAVARRESLAGNQENFLRVHRLAGKRIFQISRQRFETRRPARSAVSTPCAVDEPLHQPSPGRTWRGVEDLPRLIQAAAGVQHAVNLGPVLHPLLDLVVIAVVRNQRFVCFFVGPIRQGRRRLACGGALSDTTPAFARPRGLPSSSSNSPMHSVQACRQRKQPRLRVVPCGSAK
jgi:hypothetical protein